MLTILFNKKVDDTNSTDLSFGMGVNTGVTNTIFDTIFVGESGVEAFFDTEFLTAIADSSVELLTGFDCGLFQFDSSHAAVYYLFTVTGEQDDKDDVEIPISSFQGRLRSGSDSYLSVVVPYADEYAAAIVDRQNGDLKVDMAYKLDGAYVQRQNIAAVSMDDIRIDKGSYNQSITLSGYRQKTFATKEITLKNQTYYRLSDGKKTYRFQAINMDLNPGDTVIVGGDSLVADLISYIVSTKFQQMEVSEQ